MGTANFLKSLDTWPQKVEFLTLHAHSCIIVSHFWAMAFLRRFRQTASGFRFFAFPDSNFFTEQGRRPCIQPPTWRTRSLYSCPPVTPPGIGFPFCRLLRLAGWRWRYSNPPPHGEHPIYNVENWYIFLVRKFLAMSRRNLAEISERHLHK
jgi:hypothetical protein